MKPRDLAELLALAAIWGASFLFMRIGAAEFGPVALAGAARAGRERCSCCRCCCGAASWRRCASTGGRSSLVGSPTRRCRSCCFSFAALAITAGLSSIFNAADAAVGRADRLAVAEATGSDASRVLGLAIGFAGVRVAGLGQGELQARRAGVSAALAIAACLVGDARATASRPTSPRAA